MDICKKIGAVEKGVRKDASAISEGPVISKRQSFQHMNSIVANLVLNMTSSMRFEGSLNVDLNEISMNLVPFPRMHYLISSMTPLYLHADIQQNEKRYLYILLISPISFPVLTHRCDQIFTDAFSRDTQLIKADPKNHVYASCALLARGDIDISDMRRNIDRIRPKLSFVPWNPDSWKIGLCAKPALNQVRCNVARLYPCQPHTRIELC